MNVGLISSVETRTFQSGCCASVFTPCISFLFVTASRVCFSCVLPLCFLFVLVSSFFLFLCSSSSPIFNFVPAQFISEASLLVGKRRERGCLLSSKQHLSVFSPFNMMYSIVTSYSTLLSARSHSVCVCRAHLWVNSILFVLNAPFSVRAAIWKLKIEGLVY